MPLTLRVFRRQYSQNRYLVRFRGRRGGIAGVIMMQYLPFADARALAVYDAFERGAYRLVSAGR
ncbi:MAG: hypothetical protein Q8M18_02725 [Bradyrhizobium sp.]|nr:hypothetical protein [Bradyrhizobium sp.]